MKITTGDKNNDRWSVKTCEKLINPMRIVWHLQKKSWQKKRCFDEKNKTKRILEFFAGFCFECGMSDLVCRFLFDVSSMGICSVYFCIRVILQNEFEILILLFCGQFRLVVFFNLHITLKLKDWCLKFAALLLQNPSTVLVHPITL